MIGQTAAVAAQDQDPDSKKIALLNKIILLADNHPKVLLKQYKKLDELCKQKKELALKKSTAAKSKLMAKLKENIKNAIKEIDNNNAKKTEEINVLFLNLGELSDFRKNENCNLIREAYEKLQKYLEENLIKPLKNIQSATQFNEIADSAKKVLRPYQQKLNILQSSFIIIPSAVKHPAWPAGPRKNFGGTLVKPDNLAAIARLENLLQQPFNPDYFLNIADSIVGAIRELSTFIFGEKRKLLAEMQIILIEARWIWIKSPKAFPEYKSGRDYDAKKETPDEDENDLPRNKDIWNIEKKNAFGLREEAKENDIRYKNAVNKLLQKLPALKIALENASANAASAQEVKLADQKVIQTPGDKRKTDVALGVASAAGEASPPPPKKLKPYPSSQQAAKDQDIGREALLAAAAAAAAATTASTVAGAIAIATATVTITVIPEKKANTAHQFPTTSATASSQSVASASCSFFSTLSKLCSNRSKAKGKGTYPAKTRNSR